MCPVCCDSADSQEKIPPNVVLIFWAMIYAVSLPQRSLCLWAPVDSVLGTCMDAHANMGVYLTNIFYNPGG